MSFVASKKCSFRSLQNQYDKGDFKSVREQHERSGSVKGVARHEEQCELSGNMRGVVTREDQHE
jgi:hypothetical protein